MERGIIGTLKSEYVHQAKHYCKTSNSKLIFSYSEIKYSILISTFYLQKSVCSSLGVTDFCVLHVQIWDYVRENIFRGIDVVAN